MGRVMPTLVPKRDAAGAGALQRSSPREATSHDQEPAAFRPPRTARSGGAKVSCAMQTTGKFLEMRPLACLRAAPNNARTHSVEQIAQLAAAIREFGFTSPILISPDGEIRAGHGRLEAARTLGMTEVPTLVVGADWSPEQVRAYIIADNKLALNAGWDFDVLAAELKGLHALDFDLALTGFCSEEFAGLLANEAGGLKDPDEAPDVPERPVTQPGDVWILGKHRLACGDSTNRGTVANVLGGAKPHLMVTDPPYGVAYEPAWRKRSGLNAGGAFGVVANDDRADWREPALGSA
jgi:hypothetical protein